MKVLFATYPMAFHTPGGGEIQLLAYQRHLTALGVQVTLFDPWQPRFLEHDLMHFFSCVGGSSHLCGFVKRLGLPLVVSSSLWITKATLPQYPVDEIRLQLSMANRIVTNSDAECHALSTTLGLASERFSTAYNGAEQSFWEEVDPRLFVAHYGIDGEFVLNVGNIEPRKNQLRLMEAMKAFPQLRLVLVGHVRDEGYLKSILELGGEQVRYLGVLPNDSALLRSAYRACSVFALPSTLETPGLAALEAAAQAAVLVLTSEGSCAEYFGRHAIYVDPLDSDSIRDGIARGLKRRLAGNTGPMATRYTWDRAARNLLDVYRQVLAEAVPVGKGREA